MTARRIRRIHSAIIAAASLLVPRSLRSSWKREWLGELWYQKDRPCLLRCCLGCLPDAAWLRLHEPIHLTLGPFQLIVAVSLAVAGAWLCLPPRLEDTDHLVAIYQIGSFMKSRTPVSRSSFALWRDGVSAFERVAAYEWRAFELADKPVFSAEVSSGFFEILHARAALGRTFIDSEERSRVAVLSDAAWRRWYAADPGVIGRGLILNGEAYTVVGVMPREFGFPSPRIGLWTPLAPRRDGRPTLGVIALLKKGVTPREAEHRLAGITGTPMLALPLSEVRDQNARPAAWALLAALAAVILIVVMNVARLLCLPIPRRELAANVGYWLFFGAKSMLALALPTALWLAAMRLTDYAPPGGIGALAFMLAAVWAVLLLSMGALLWSLWDQRLRCRVCLRPLRMPMARGVWSSTVIDCPAVEYICPFGHGKLSVAGAQSLRSSQWIPFGDVWRELLVR